MNPVCLEIWRWFIGKLTENLSKYFMAICPKSTVIWNVQFKFDHINDIKHCNDEIMILVNLQICHDVSNLFEMGFVKYTYYQDIPTYDLILFFNKFTVFLS